MKEKIEEKKYQNDDQREIFSTGECVNLSSYVGHHMHMLTCVLNAHTYGQPKHNCLLHRWCACEPMTHQRVSPTRIAAAIFVCALHILHTAAVARSVI